MGPLIRSWRCSLRPTDHPRRVIRPVRSRGQTTEVSSVQRASVTASRNHREWQARVMTNVLVTGGAGCGPLCAEARITCVNSIILRRQTVVEHAQHSYGRKGLVFLVRPGIGWQTRREFAGACARRVRRSLTQDAPYRSSAPSGMTTLGRMSVGSRSPMPPDLGVLPVSAVIVHYRSNDTVTRCVSSLVTQSLPPAEILSFAIRPRAHGW